MGNATSSGINTNDRTLILIKPDGVLRRSVGVSILRQLLAKGYIPCAFMELRATKELIEAHYSTSFALPRYNGNPEGVKTKELVIDYMISYNLLAIAFTDNRGPNVAYRMRMDAGNSSTPATATYTLRSQNLINALMNTIHSSDSVVEAKRELELWQPHFEQYYRLLGYSGSAQVTTDVARQQVEQYMATYSGYQDSAISAFRSLNQQLMNRVRDLKYKPVPICTCLQGSENKEMTFEIAQNDPEFSQHKEAYLNLFKKPFVTLNNLDESVLNAITSLVDCNTEYVYVGTGRSMTLYTVIGVIIIVIIIVVAVVF